MLFISAATFAQTDGLSYQAVIINPDSIELPGVDATGNVLPNKDISIRFSILNEYGNIEYQEIQYTTTDTYGMINLFVGEGEQTVGNGFDTINWDGLSKDLKVDIDFYAGTNFTTLGAQKLSFIPYAYHRNINASGDLQVDGNSVFNGDFLVEGITTFNSDLVIEGEMTLNNNLNVIGNTTFDGDTMINGTLGVQGVTSLYDDLNVEGISNLNNNLNVNNGNSTTLSGSLLVEGLTTFNNGLVIEGETLINDNLNVDGNFDVNGTTKLHNNFSVEDNASTTFTGSVGISGITTLKNNLEVVEAAQTHLTGILSVDGETNLNNSFKVNESPSTFTGSVSVSGVTQLKNTLNVIDGANTNLSGDLNVLGKTNLEDEFNVNNESTSNLSGELNVEGVSNLNNNLNVEGTTRLNENLWVFGNTRMENNLYVGAKLQVADSLNVEGNTLLSNLVVRGSNDVGGASGANHIALFENTSTSSESDGIAIRIHGNASGKLGYKNRFITFYGSANGGDYMAGRIESYDLLAGDLWESFPIPDFANLIDVFDFSQVLEYTPPSLDFDPGALPSMSGGQLPSANFSRGSLPSLSIDWGEFDYSFSRGSLPSLSFSPGSFPTLNPGSLPSGSLDIGSLNLNFENFFNPTAGSNAVNDITAMTAWGMRNGDPGFLPTGPWGIALTPLILAAKQVARDQGVIYGSKGADYAEWLEKENPEEKYMFGEVVGVKGGKISRNTTNADQVMSISLAPIVLGNMPDANRKEAFEKVGFMGQVPVLTLGDVKVGDYIVASGYNDGYAKALSAKEISLKDLKNIIGRAWTGSNGNKASLINVSVGLKTNEWVTIFEQQEAKINDLETKLKQLENLSERLEKLESKIETLEIN